MCVCVCVLADGRQNLRGDEGYFPSNFVAPITLNEEGSSQSPPTGQPGEGGGGGGGGASSAEVERLRADLAAKDAQLKRMMESQGDSGKQGEAIRAIQEQMSRELEQVMTRSQPPSSLPLLAPFLAPILHACSVCVCVLYLGVVMKVCFVVAMLVSLHVLVNV